MTSPFSARKNQDRSYDTAPSVHPEVVSGGVNVWTPVTTQLPPPHETVLARDEDGDIYQARVCYGMHEPWWCGHSELNFGVILQDKGITITEWRHRG